MSPDERAAIEARHSRFTDPLASTYEEPLPDWCANDEEPWPCDTAKVLAALGEAEQALVIAADALVGISEMSDATEQSSFREEAWAALEAIESPASAARAALAATGGG